MDYFVGISYALVGLEDQSCYCLSLNNMLGSNCLT